jgi:hypothetical protein
MPVNDRISCLCVRGKFFNCAHAPTKEKPEKEREAFCEALQKTYDECSRADTKIFSGDMNAQFGKEDMYILTTGKHSLHFQSNDND